MLGRKHAVTLTNGFGRFDESGFFIITDWFRKVCVKLDAGESVVLCGPSGVGKSYSLLALYNLLCKRKDIRVVVLTYLSDRKFRYYVCTFILVYVFPQRNTLFKLKIFNRGQYRCN